MYGMSLQNLTSLLFCQEIYSQLKKVQNRKKSNFNICPFGQFKRPWRFSFFMQKQSLNHISFNLNVNEAGIDIHICFIVCNMMQQ